MEIKRDISNKLSQWKDSRYRKPLLLQGARQVGKSFILKRFGMQYFENYCYVNFDLEKEHKTEFAVTKDPARIVSYLTTVKGMDIKD